MTIIGSIQYLAQSVVFGGIMLAAIMIWPIGWQALSHTRHLEEGSKGRSFSLPDNAQWGDLLNAS